MSFFVLLKLRLRCEFLVSFLWHFDCAVPRNTAIYAFRHRCGIPALSTFSGQSIAFRLAINSYSRIRSFPRPLLPLSSPHTGVLCPPCTQCSAQHTQPSPNTKHYKLHLNMVHPVLYFKIKMYYCNLHPLHCTSRSHGTLRTASPTDFVCNPLVVTCSL
mgnify:CR=1 FL=1